MKKWTSVNDHNNAHLDIPEVPNDGAQVHHTLYFIIAVMLTPQRQCMHSEVIPHSNSTTPALMRKCSPTRFSGHTAKELKADNLCLTLQ
jgi:hypothetical protein